MNNISEDSTEENTDDENEEDEAETADIEQNIQEQTTKPEDINEWLAGMKSSKNDEIDDMISYEELKKQVNSLNSEQRKVFDDAHNRIVADKDPFYLYISGDAGTGKSYLLTALIQGSKHLYRKSGDKISQPNVLIMAPSACAAYLVGGQTIHSALAMDATSNIYQPKIKTSAEQVSLAEKYQNLEIVFIDEVSMVGTNMLLAIHEALYQIKARKDKPFGG